jgi:hypothetical protein
MGACGVIILLGGVAKIATGLESFRLPDCDASGTIETVKDLFKSANAELDEVTDARLVSDENGKNCTAHVKGQGEEANVTYRVFWDGWSKKVQLGEVTIDPAPAPAANSVR